MTREEAINKLTECAKDRLWGCGEYLEALNMAIKALEQDHCEDCISREKAKQFLYERLDRLNDDELYDIFSRIIDDMYNELLPVEQVPKTGHWKDNKCDVCGASRPPLFDNYCPNCGCPMEIER